MMVFSKHSWLGLLALALLMGFLAAALATKLEAATATPQPTVAARKTAITGTVVNAEGPVAGAHVRIHLSDELVLSAEDGSFTVNSLTARQPVTLTAWSDGHYIAWQRIIPAGKPITLTLNAHYQTDNPAYEWFEQEFEQGLIEGSAACGECHTAYTEWQADAHAQSAQNYRFLTLYSGTDVHGNKGPLTKRNPDGSAEPREPNEPYYGAGFQLDNLGRAGNCAACHTPMAAKIPNNQNCAWSGCHLGTTVTRSEQLPDELPVPLSLKGDAAEGISCEFCHKIGSVTLNRKTGLPYDDSPGILSLRLFRPTDATHDLLFGPFDDVVRTDLPSSRDSYLPLQRESQFCAGCHYGVMGGVVGNMQVTGGLLVYSSFAEWLDSPYSDPQTGQSCQDCHMPRADYRRFVFADKGGTERPAQQISNHHMLGKSDPEFMASAVTLTATAKLQGNELAVSVTAVNDGAGHAVPTDSVLHHVMLVVTATDANGKTLTLRQGPTLPVWTGNYAEQPGQAFAKLIRDKWSGEMPSAAFWREGEIAEDSRLQPFVPVTNQFTFAMPRTGDAEIQVQLIYRRAFQELMTQKGWDDEDLVMAEQMLTVSKP